MALKANAITSLEHIKVFLEIKDDSHDSLLELLIDGVSALFDSYCGHQFAEATDTTLYLDGNGERELELPRWPVTSIATVELNDIALTEGADEDYVLYSSNHDAYLWKTAGTWGTGKKSIKLTTFKAGFTAALMPSDVEVAALKQIGKEYQKWKAKNWAETSRSFPDGSISMSTENLLPEVKETLSRWKKL